MTVVMLWYRGSFFDFDIFQHAWSWGAAIIAKMCSSGGSGTWRFDGSPPESHGEVLSSCLVWESRDERSPPSDQKVSFPHSSTWALLVGLVFACFSCQYFLSVAALALTEVGIFLAVLSYRVSVSLLIQTSTDVFWKFATEQCLWILVSCIISHPDPWHLIQIFDVLSKMWKSLFKGPICRCLYGQEMVSITSLCCFQVEGSCEWQEKASHIDISRGWVWPCREIKFLCPCQFSVCLCIIKDKTWCVLF